MDDQDLGGRAHVAERLEPRRQGVDELRVVALVVVDQSRVRAGRTVATRGGQVTQLEHQRLYLDVLQASDPTLAAALTQDAKRAVDAGTGVDQPGHVARDRPDADDRTQAQTDPLQEVQGNANATFLAVARGV